MHVCTCMHVHVPSGCRGTGNMCRLGGVDCQSVELVRESTLDGTRAFSARPSAKPLAPRCRHKLPEELTLKLPCPLAPCSFVPAPGTASQVGFYFKPPKAGAV